MKYEIRTVKLEGDNYEACDESDPAAIWALYEIGNDGLSMHVSDHPTRDEANTARDARVKQSSR